MPTNLFVPPPVMVPPTPVPPLSFVPPSPVPPPMVTPSMVTPPTVPPQTDFLVKLQQESCSRGNFAAKLCRFWFSEERKAGNVRGKLNKDKLCPERIGKIRATSFQMFPLTPGEGHERAWSTCIKAIDEANRRLNRNKQI